MRTLLGLLQRLRKYKDAEYIYDHETGYIVWRYGTGDNLEILFLVSAEKRKGNATHLCRMMIHKLESCGERPYHSLFLFRLAGNVESQAFFTRLGFKEVNLGRSIYGGDDTVILWIAWDDFKLAVGV